MPGVKIRARTLWSAAPLALAASLALAPNAHAQSLEELQRLSVEDLANLDVTSVSKSSESLSDAPAAIYVITHDEILRSGARRLPEMLRLAPNLFVAQTSAATHVITARGLSGNQADQAFTNKLLVLIDGRSVYTPLFSGVYWDMQDVLPEDIDRIEVISGPGATLWGANAVNGVINIITRSSAETQGGFVEGRAGNQEQGGAARIGGRAGADTTFRLYARGFHQDTTDDATGAPGTDHWRKLQGGFRLDWTRTDSDVVTVQGDIFHATGGVYKGVEGGDLLARWSHNWKSGSQLQVQAYFDREARGPDTTGGTPLWVNTLDFDLQHSFAIGGRQQIVWGGGLRSTRYHIVGTPSLFFAPARRTLTLANGFVQDTVTLAPSLRAILGVKLEDDPYAGTSTLPSARLSWSPGRGAMLWAAVSRAVRSPTPFDEDVREVVGGVLFVSGNPDFRTEKLWAYEAGVRVQPSSRLSLSVSGYYNQYDDLRSIELTPATVFPLYWGNLIDGHTYGLEAWGNYQAAPWWRLSAGLNLMSEHFRFRPGSSRLAGLAQVGDDPRAQAKLRSSMSLGPKLTLDADLRYVSTLREPHVPAYVELNSRVAWSVTERVQLAVSGFNLLHGRHQEFPAPQAQSVPRSAYAELRLRF